MSISFGDLIAQAYDEGWLRFLIWTGGLGAAEKPDIAIRFNGGFPAALLAMRVAFVAIVLAMAVFGLAPIRTSVARDGITACVLALVVVGFTYMFMEGHYVNSGRASIINLTDHEHRS